MDEDIFRQIYHHQLKLPAVKKGSEKDKRCYVYQARILLVDDESAIIDNLASFLERSGFEVKTATNGEEALANKKLKPLS